MSRNHYPSSFQITRRRWAAAIALPILWTGSTWADQTNGNSNSEDPPIIPVYTSTSINFWDEQASDNENRTDENPSNDNGPLHQVIEDGEKGEESEYSASRPAMTSVKPTQAAGGIQSSPAAGTSAKPAAAAPASAKPKKPDDLKKKVAGAYKDLFYQNDFSYLSNPAYNDWNLGEGLKQMPVGDGKLDIGGQFRQRYHHEQNIRGLGLTGRDDDFLLDRTRLYFNYKANSWLRVYSEFLDAGSSWENFAPRAIEVQHLDIQNLFADIKMLEGCDGNLTGRFGRQELSFGNQRLISPLDWANVRRKFDGGRLTYDNDERTLDAFLVRPPRLDIDRVDPANLDQVLYGIYNSSKAFANGKVDTYYFGFHDELIDQRVHTLGMLVNGEADQWLWDNEVGYQFGRNPDGSDISAAAITCGFGRKLQGKNDRKLWLYYDWASGDDSINNGWNHLFPLGHRFLGFMDLYGRRNINDVNVLFTSSPTKKFNFITWYHYLFLANGNQGPYNVTLNAFNPGGTVGSRSLGHELDFLGTYKMSVRSDLVLGYSHFFDGAYYRTSTNANGGALFAGDADFFYTQYHLNF